MTAKHAGRKGRPYLRARALVLATSNTCWICGHPEARTADHVIPVWQCIANGWHHLLDNPANMRPAHGTGNLCPECGRSCNQERANGQVKPGRKSRVW